jgi:hypothetical protein
MGDCIGGQTVSSVRLVSIDIDGTLLNTQHHISPLTVKVIQEVVARGVVVTLSTGRMFTSAQKVARQIGLDVPLITYNGALLKSSESEDVLYYLPIDPSVGERLACDLVQRGFHFHAYVDEVVYAPKLSDRTLYYAQRSGVRVGVLETGFLARSSGAGKILVMGEAESLDWLQMDLHQHYEGQIIAMKSHPSYLEIVHSMVSKGRTLAWLAKHLDIRQKDVMAIGDQYNDVEMIQYAGIGVAMGNAPETVKQIAFDVTHSNDDDGAAHSLIKWVLT